MSRSERVGGLVGCGVGVIVGAGIGAKYGKWGMGSALAGALPFAMIGLYLGGMVGILGGGLSVWERAGRGETRRR